MGGQLAAKEGKDGFSMNGWLTEQLKTVKNLCEVAEILIDNGRQELLPTVLELLQVEIQQVIEENCIEMPDNENMGIDNK